MSRGPCRSQKFLDTLFGERGGPLAVRRSPRAGTKKVFERARELRRRTLDAAHFGRTLVPRDTSRCR